MTRPCRQPDSATPTEQILRVTVKDGLAGVNRVLSVLRHRGTTPQMITARVAAETDTWVVEHRLIANTEQTALLHRQLERLPVVVAVQTMTRSNPHPL